MSKPPLHKHEWIEVSRTPVPETFKVTVEYECTVPGCTKTYTYTGPVND